MRRTALKRTTWTVAMVVVIVAVLAAILRSGL
jgi:hypothetical protein